MKSSFIETNQIRLHVMTDGPEDGTPVILLHGFPEFHYGWRRQVPALAAAGFHVIAPDQRGYNLSDKPRGVAAYDVNLLAADILGLMDSFGIQKARVVGHDWGAVVAWTLAIEHPERVERLAILNVPHPDVMTDFLLHDRAQRRRSWYVFFFQIPWLVEWVLARNDHKNMTDILVRSGRRNTFSAEELLEYKKAWAQKGALTGMLNWYRAIMRSALRSMFGPKKPMRRVRVPVRMLWGRRDFALGEAMAPASIALCDQGELTFFPHATHWVQHDAADEVNRALIEFMS